MATESQTLQNNYDYLYSGYKIRQGQRLTISNRIVSDLTWKLLKQGSPPGNVTFAIRKVSDDSVIVSKVWGAASALSTSATDETATFDTPTLINEEAYITCEYSEGDATNRVRIYWQNSDVKANEQRSFYSIAWNDQISQDMYYIYTYTLPAAAGKCHGYIIG